jgi:hypothetical protein
MKNSVSNKLLSLCALSFFVLTSVANAGIISITLGNGASGLVDGDMPTACDLVCAGGISYGQVPPFDAVRGHEIISDPKNVNWSFNYGPITDTILSATFSFGIWDHDSSASGSQLDSFALDGMNLTTELDALFESAGGSLDRQFKIYTMNLSTSLFASLADGLFSANLDIGGTGLLTNGLTQVVSESPYNAFLLVHSTLNITTQDVVDPEPPTDVPEPSTLLLFAVALLSFKRYSRR